MSNGWPATMTFKDAFCRRFAFSDDLFEEKLFWKCIKPSLRPLTHLVRRLNPDYFHNDFAYLSQIGQTTTRFDFKNQANDIPNDPKLTDGFLRLAFRLRISGALLMKVYEQVIAG